MFVSLFTANEHLTIYAYVSVQNATFSTVHLEIVCEDDNPICDRIYNIAPLIFICLWVKGENA